MITGLAFYTIWLLLLLFLSFYSNFQFLLAPLIFSSFSSPQFSSSSSTSPFFHFPSNFLPFNLYSFLSSTSLTSPQLFSSFYHFPLLHFSQFCYKVPLLFTTSSSPLNLFSLAFSPSTLSPPLIKLQKISGTYMLLYTQKHMYTV